MARYDHQLATGLGNCIAVSLDENQASASLRLCAVLDPAVGSGGPPQLIALRETLDARIVLGCVLDTEQQVHRWLELWVQDIAGFAQSPMAAREMTNNHLLDQRWKRRCVAIARAGRSDVIRGPWEHVHPLPILLDVSNEASIHPVDDQSGQRWRLCEDDEVLTRHGLPPYSTTLHRYLYVDHDGTSRFLPLSADAPSGESTVSMGSMLSDDVIPLNLGGGLMMVRTYDPVTYEGLSDLLSGGKLQNSTAGGLFANRIVGLSACTSHDAASSGRVFLGRHGRAARLLETLHLKLRAVSDAVASVRAFVEQTQAPLLDVNAGSFSVRMGPIGCGLPTLWTAQTVLGDPGEAIAVPFEATAHRYFVPARTQPSIYQPSASTRSIQGRGSMRLRQVIDDGDGSNILEGTFATSERIEPAGGDLLWMRLPMGGGTERLDVHATLDAESALAAGEWRFRTHARSFDEQQRQSLRQYEGIPMENVLFDLVPLLSTPCDVYSLAVLAARTLLVDADTTLAVAIDEVHSLARQLASEHDGDVGIELRIRSVFDNDARWATGLGPQRLLRDVIEPDEAFSAIPTELWYTVLATIVKALPGVGPDSHHRDLGDVSPGALHTAFDPMLNELASLIERTRSLITADWRANREIHDVAKQLINGSESGATAAPGEQITAAT